VLRAGTFGDSNNNNSQKVFALIPLNSFLASTWSMIPDRCFTPQKEMQMGV
jgi:hypothetical protein